MNYIQITREEAINLLQGNRPINVALYCGVEVPYFVKDETFYTGGIDGIELYMLNNVADSCHYCFRYYKIVNDKENNNTECQINAKTIPLSELHQEFQKFIYNCNLNGGFSEEYAFNKEDFYSFVKHLTGKNIWEVFKCQD